MADAAYLPATGTPTLGSVVLAGYLASSGAAHPWSAEDWARARAWPNIGWLLPIYVYATGQGDPAGAARSSADQASSHGAPRGSVLVLDVEQGSAEAAHRSGFPTEWAGELVAEGFEPWIYTSRSTAYAAAVPGAGAWLADWTGRPHLLPNSMATQWTSPLVDRSLAFDLSELNPAGLRRMWPTNPRGAHPMPELAAPIVAIAQRPQGDGYWLVAGDGGVFAFGNAHAGWGLGAKHINAAIVDAFSSHTGNGLTLVGADGGVFTFGDAPFHGSVPGDGIGPAPGTPGDPTP